MWAPLIKLIVTTAVAAFTGWITKLIERFLRRKKIDQDSSVSVDPLKKANTAEEIKDATRSSLDGF